MRVRDTTALVCGLVMLPVAAVGLFTALGHTLGWPLLQKAVPAVLVVIGLLGLAAIRSKNKTNRKV